MEIIGNQAEASKSIHMRWAANCYTINLVVGFQSLLEVEHISTSWSFIVENICTLQVPHIHRYSQVGFCEIAGSFERANATTNGGHCL